MTMIIMTTMIIIIRMITYMRAHTALPIEQAPHDTSQDRLKAPGDDGDDDGDGDDGDDGGDGGAGGCDECDCGGVVGGDEDGDVGCDDDGGGEISSDLYRLFVCDIEKSNY